MCTSVNTIQRFGGVLIGARSGIMQTGLMGVPANVVLVQNAEDQRHGTPMIMSEQVLG